MFAQCRVSSVSAALLLVAIVATSNLAAAQFTNFTLKPLPYDYVALEPLMGNETVTLHHDVHGAASLNTLNAAIVNTTLVNLVQGGASEEDLITVVRQSWQNGAPIKGVFNGAAQAWNHIHFWDGMKANPTAAPNTPPPGPLSDAINAAYGTFDNFTAVFKQAGLDRFGSGWVWLLYNGSCALSVKSTPNGENYIAYNNGSVSILSLDVWEHSYYLDVRNNRAAYIDNFMKLVNWDVVSARYPADPAVCQTNAAPQSVSSMGTMAPPAAPPVAPTNAAGTVAVAAKLLLAIAALVVLVAL